MVGSISTGDWNLPFLHKAQASLCIPQKSGPVMIYTCWLTQAAMIMWILIITAQRSVISLKFVFSSNKPFDYHLPFFMSF